VARAEKYFFLVLRVYLGAFNFASGINYFVRVWPQPIPADPVGSAYMSVTLHLGMFQLAKVVETVGGLCLIADLFVPFALVLLFPVTVNVFIMNVFFSPLAHVIVSGARNFAFHVLLLAAYARYYLPFMVPTAGLRPLWRGFRPGPLPPVASDPEQSKRGVLHNA
jgi:putative oxidoreductase